MHLLFDMSTGISGDMVLGALCSLGLDFPAWKEKMATLGLPVQFTLTTVDKKGIQAARMNVVAPEEHHHRGLEVIENIIRSSALPDPVQKNSIRIFQRLAMAEAAVHGVPVEKVHFHEVGALDAIADIVGACLGFHMLKVEDYWATPLPFGTGWVNAAHGKLPVPVPATTKLAEGFPSYRTQIEAELCTPTGTAIVTTLAKPLPAGWPYRPMSTGYGAGRRDFPDRANVLRLQLIEPGIGRLQNDVFEIECNLDDCTPELVSHTMDLLRRNGALDAWQEPILMKKERSAVKICVLAPKDLLDSISWILFKETSTLGIRFHQVQRRIGEKRPVLVKLPWGEVRCNELVFAGWEGVKRVPEYESCRILALKAGVPLRQVYEAVQAVLPGGVSPISSSESVSS